jgi:hypothetical protein
MSPTKLSGDRPPGGEREDEAWSVLDADPERSRIYAGLRAGVTAADVRAALAAGTAPHTLHNSTPASAIACSRRRDGPPPATPPQEGTRRGRRARRPVTWRMHYLIVVSSGRYQ